MLVKPPDHIDLIDEGLSEIQQETVLNPANDIKSDQSQLVVDIQEIQSVLRPVEKRIMIVDDEPFNLQSLKVVIQQSVKRLGMNKDILNRLIDEASDGQEALNLMIKRCTSHEHRAEYSLIFMDCQMPVMNGYKSTLEIRQFIERARLVQPMVVACTGNVEDSMIEKAWRSKMDEIVQKPASVEVVSEILKEVINFK